KAICAGCLQPAFMALVIRAAGQAPEWRAELPLHTLGRPLSIFSAPPPLAFLQKGFNAKKNLSEMIVFFIPTLYSQLVNFSLQAINFNRHHFFFLVVLKYLEEIQPMLSLYAAKQFLFCTSEILVHNPGSREAAKVTSAV